MPHHLLHLLGAYLARYGYWTVALALLLENAGLPLPGVVYAITLLVEIGGGLLLLIGFQAKPVAVVLALFSVGAAILFHNNFAD